MPLNGEVLDAPPTFEWPAGDYAYYRFYSLFNYSGVDRPMALELRLPEPRLAMPDWWWKYLSDTDHLWVVFGVNNAGGETPDLLVLQSFKKQYPENCWASMKLRNNSMATWYSGVRHSFMATLSVDGQQVQADSGTTSPCIWLKCDRSYDIAVSAVGQGTSFHVDGTRFLSRDCLYIATYAGDNAYVTEHCPGGCPYPAPASDADPALESKLPAEEDKADEIPDEVAEAIWAFILEYLSTLDEAQELKASTSEPSTNENAPFSTSDDICFVDALKP